MELLESNYGKFGQIKREGEAMIGVEKKEVMVK